MALTFLGIVLAGALLLFLGPFFVYPSVVPSLAPVLPRPDHVPKEATATYEWKASGMHWAWRRVSPHGSAIWSATDTYARVTLELEGNAISYFTPSDYIEFDTGAAISGRPSPEIGGEPCPFRVSDAELARFRQLASEALLQAQTTGEAAILRRIADRLAVADGGALTSNTNGDGCADLTLEEWQRPQTRFDPLSSVR